MNRTEGNPFQRLLVMAREGNRTALGQLLETYRGYLMVSAQGQIGRRLGRKAGASDVVQATFLRAQEAFCQFDGSSEAEFLSWLRSILASRLISLLRQYQTQRRNCRLEIELYTELESSINHLRPVPAGTQSTPSGEASRRELSFQLSNALEQLPEHYREVIVLHHLEGLAFDDIAVRMKKSPAAIQQIWIRALVKLRKSLIV